MEEIPFFRGRDYNISTSIFSNLLHDDVVSTFEEEMANYVGAKYSCTLNSATNAIFLLLLGKNTTVEVPSMIPPVVLNAIVTSGNSISFRDDVNWIGDSYVLHDFGEYKIIDSAQKIERDQFKKEAKDSDIMFFSHYPTKPVGSCDGATIVSNDKEKIDWIRSASFNGMSKERNNWDRSIIFPGYKMYMNSIQAYIALQNLRNLDSDKEKISLVRGKYNHSLGLDNKSGHLYRISVDNNRKFIEYCKKRGIVCGVHYFPQHNNPVYSPHSSGTFACPLSEDAGKKTISIPFFPEITPEDQSKIIEAIEKYERS